MSDTPDQMKWECPACGHTNIRKEVGHRTLYELTICEECGFDRANLRADSHGGKTQLGYLIRARKAKMESDEA